MQLYCPQCDHPLESGATRCPNCPATFTDPNGWHPIEGERVRVNKKWALASGLTLFGAFYVLPAIGLSLSYQLGNPNLGFLFGVYLMLAIPIGIIAAIAAQIASHISKKG